MSAVQEQPRVGRRRREQPPVATPTAPRPPRLRERSRLPLGTRLADRYRIDGVLGAGGMATVYLARDLVLCRDVAVKVDDADANGRLSALAVEEGRIAADLQHPAIATVFDAGIAAADGHDVAFLVLEYVRRGDLRRHVLVEPPAWRDTAWLGVDLADGLAHLHERGYLHRDVKPANVLIAGRDRDGRLRAKLTDFGIASGVGQVRARSTSTLGTAAYISPERVSGLQPTAGADVYALGLVLLETLTGHVEYGGDPTRAAFERLDRDPVVPAAVPAPLAEVLVAMTDRVPALRPDAAQVAARLREVLAADTARPAPIARSGVGASVEVAEWPPPAFTAVTALATRLLAAPYACVVLQGQDRASVHAATGWRGEPLGVAVRSLPADRGDGAPWSVPDLAAHGPVDRDLRSFAGAPLTSARGDRLGTLCVFDRGPRAFTAIELGDLAELAALVTRELELRLAARRALFAR